MSVIEFPQPAFLPAVPWTSRAAGLAEGVVPIWLAVMVAFGMSLQYLAQPFVWRNWPMDEMLKGWLYILRDRLIVALAIALAIALLDRGRIVSLRTRSVVIAVCILAGASIGEWVVRLLYADRDSLAVWFTHALRWSAIALAASSTYYLWRRSIDSHEQLRRADLRLQSVEQQLTNTRLTALRKQIEPHFLFNTLATIRRLQHTAPASGAQVLANLIDYLGRLLPLLERSEVPLGQEADLVEAYLAVIQVRMADRLRVKISVPPSLRRARVPPLALATLVENAVKHGLSPLQEGGLIEVVAAAEKGMLELSVCDNGVGLVSGATGGTGIGLYNVRTRLATLHGARASLRVLANEASGVRATISLPLELESA